MAELVDAADLKSVGRKAVGVQVPPWALFESTMVINYAKKFFTMGKQLSEVIDSNYRAVDGVTAVLANGFGISLQVKKSRGKIIESRVI